MAAALVLATAGCSPAAPVGVRRDGDRFTVLVGRQCSDGNYLTTLRVSNYDRKAHRRVGSPLWEITADRPQAVRSVVLGEVPDGYREITDTLDTQRVGATLAVDVVIGREHGVLFDVRRMRDGRVLNSEAEVVSERQFRDDFGCPR